MLPNQGSGLSVFAVAVVAVDLVIEPVIELAPVVVVDMRKVTLSV